MQNPFGTSQIQAILQGTISAAALSVKAAYGGALTRTASGVLVATVVALPATVTGATENSTGINDSSQACIVQNFPTSGLTATTAAIVYGPNASAPTLAANQVQFTFTNSLGSTVDPTGTTNITILSCNDGVDETA